MFDKRSVLKLMAMAPLSSRILRSQEKGPSTSNGGTATGAAQNSGSVITYPDQMAGSPLGDPLPGQKWRVHDRERPQSRRVTPGLPLPAPGPSSDATVLFDGTNLSQWQSWAIGGKVGPPKWKVENGYCELLPGAGSLITRESFGDCQLHVEWMVPPGTDPSRRGQKRGNSGVIFMKHYEIQVLSSYDNPTYPDGAAGALYGLYPPLVNPCRPEGEWNSYDIVFKAPRFSGAAVERPASVTLFFNGLIVHDHVELLGTTSIEPIARYEPHAPEEPLVLQGHMGPARFRNIWIRRLRGYDA